LTGLEITYRILVGYNDYKQN